jgi:uncharacterized protein YndB with AHSA1/START domain
MLSNNTQTNIDRSNFTITFRRVLSASREKVFDAWTRPEHIQYWWDPSGKPLSECVVDLRPGGSFKFTNQDSAHSPPFSGSYRSIQRPSQLEFEALGAIGTVRLEAKGAATQMTVSIRCASAEHLEQFLKLGVDDGTARTLDNLVAYLGQLVRVPHQQSWSGP